MNATHEQQINQFLQTPVHRALIDYYDPAQNQVRHLVASKEPASSIIEAIIASRDNQAISLFGDKADGRDVMYADALDAGIAHLGLARVLELKPSRVKAVERYVFGRAAAVSSAVFATAAEFGAPGLFNEAGRPTGIEGYAALRRTIAIAGHAHTGRDEHGTRDGGMQMRKNGNPYSTHPDMGGEFMLRTNKKAGIKISLGEAGGEQIAMGAHDITEDGVEADSSHWVHLQTLISALAVKNIAELSAVADPSAIALEIYYMTRNKDIDGERMDYQGGYIRRMAEDFHLPSTRHNLSRILASTRTVKLKRVDQTVNRIDPPFPRHRRINKDYVFTDKLFRELHADNPAMLRFFDQLDALTIADRDRYLESVADVDMRAVIDFFDNAAAKQLRRIT